ncbi:hypothetical protein LXL04_007541 [Taraxacum kok-saghyz]
MLLSIRVEAEFAEEHTEDVTTTTSQLRRSDRACLQRPSSCLIFNLRFIFNSRSSATIFSGDHQDPRRPLREATTERRRDSRSSTSSSTSDSSSPIHPRQKTGFNILRHFTSYSSPIPDSSPTQDHFQPPALLLRFKFLREKTGFKILWHFFSVNFKSQTINFVSCSCLKTRHELKFVSCSCRVRVWPVSCSCLIPQTRIEIRVVFVFAKFVSCKFVSDTNTRHDDTNCQVYFYIIHGVVLTSISRKLRVCSGPSFLPDNPTKCEVLSKHDHRIQVLIVILQFITNFTRKVRESAKTGTTGTSASVWPT